MKNYFNEKAFFVAVVFAMKGICLDGLRSLQRDREKEQLAKKKEKEREERDRVRKEKQKELQREKEKNMDEVLENISIDIVEIDGKRYYKNRYGNYVPFKGNVNFVVSSKKNEKGGTK